MIALILATIILLLILIPAWKSINGPGHVGSGGIGVFIMIIAPSATALVCLWIGFFITLIFGASIEYSLLGLLVPVLIWAVLEGHHTLRWRK